jgi:pSer/pThr/pTyr-binding forkhead associated (FHA) protein
MREHEKLRWRVRSQDRFALLCDGEMVIGRSPYCSLILEHETLSRVHATLRVAGNGLVLDDQNSSNGTFVNGARISAPTPVGPGDDIRLGKVLVSIEADLGRCLMETGRIQALRPGDVPLEQALTTQREDDGTERPGNP